MSSAPFLKGLQQDLKKAETPKMKKELLRWIFYSEF
jgi:hypothetical protein